MSSPDNQNGSSPDMSRNRRGSVTSAAFTNLFQRSNSTSAGTAVFPGPITTAAAIGNPHRRLSVTTVGLSGTSPTNSNPFSIRRASLSTNNSDSIDENAVEEDDGATSARTAPTTPFARRMSFGAQAMRNLRPSGGSTSPGTSNGRPQAPPHPHPPPPSIRRRMSSAATPSSAGAWRAAQYSSQASNATNPRSASDVASAARTDQGFNWSEQLRSRAESSVSSAQRPSVSFAGGLGGSPPRGGPSPHHDRAKSVSDMPAPPAQAPKPRQDPRPKPDHFQERILKGDFYMD